MRIKLISAVQSYSFLSRSSSLKKPTCFALPLFLVFGRGGSSSERSKKQKKKASTTSAGNSNEVEGQNGKVHKKMQGRRRRCCHGRLSGRCTNSRPNTRPRGRRRQREKDRVGSPRPPNCPNAGGFGEFRRPDCGGSVLQQRIKRARERMAEIRGFRGGVRIWTKFT